MSPTERLDRLKSLLDAGRCLTRQFLLEEFGTSPATVKRDIAHLRDRERGGWRFDRQAATIGTQYELPGLWLTAEEIHALLTMQHLLAHLDAGGLLGPHIAPLVERLDRLLGVGSNASAEVVRRIRVQTVGAQGPLPHFQAVGTCQKAGGMTRFATGTWQAGSIYRRRESLGVLRLMLALCRLSAFECVGELGNAHSHVLFDRLAVSRQGDAGAPARNFGAHAASFDSKALGAGDSIDAAPGVTLTRRC